MLRRCFSDPNEDLTVWVDAGGEIKGFEHCYEKGNAEGAGPVDQGRGIRL
jgi:hypothetical protein